MLGEVIVVAIGIVLAFAAGMLVAFGFERRGVGALVSIAVLLGSVWTAQMEFGSQHNVTFTVRALDDQATSKGHKYLVFTTSGETYEDTDAWLHGKTDSSDVWGRLLSGGTSATWTCPVYGYRNTWSSSYPDILDGCKLLKQGTPVSSVG